MQVGQSLKSALRAMLPAPLKVQSPFREEHSSVCVARRAGAPLRTMCVCKGMQTQQGCCWAHIPPDLKPGRHNMTST